MLSSPRTMSPPHNLPPSLVSSETVLAHISSQNSSQVIPQFSSTCTFRLRFFVCFIKIELELQVKKCCFRLCSFSPCVTQLFLLSYPGRVKWATLGTQNVHPNGFSGEFLGFFPSFLLSHLQDDPGSGFNLFPLSLSLSLSSSLVFLLQLQLLKRR